MTSRCYALGRAVNSEVRHVPAARDAWSQLHARDPRSKELTAAEKSGQQTLLAWARTNTPDALTRSTAQRGRPESYRLHFGKWKGLTPLQLILLAAGPGYVEGGAAKPQAERSR